jgi:hypothetical protein
MRAAARRREEQEHGERGGRAMLLTSFSTLCHDDDDFFLWRKIIVRPRPIEKRKNERKSLIFDFDTKNICQKSKIRIWQKWMALSDDSPCSALPRPNQILEWA